MTPNPGGTPGEGLGRGVDFSGNYLVEGGSGLDGSRGDGVVFDTVTGSSPRTLTPLADVRQLNDEFGFAVALRWDEVIVCAQGDSTGFPSGSGSLFSKAFLAGLTLHPCPSKVQTAAPALGAILSEKASAFGNASVFPGGGACFEIE